MSDSKKTVNISLLLKGVLTQFNLSLLLVFCGSIALLCVSKNINDRPLMYAGSITALVIIAFAGVMALRRYWRQECRPEENPSKLEVIGPSGRAIIVQNPPDSLLNPDSIQTLIRGCLVGYDENLCPDAKVIGCAADGNVLPFTPEDIEAFKRKHKEEISAKRKLALNAIEKNIDIPTESEPDGIGLDKPKNLAQSSDSPQVQTPPPQTS